MPCIGILLETIWRDLARAWKTLLRSPGFSAAAVMAIALGIAANTTVFSFLHVLILRPLPVRNPDELVQLLHQYPGDPRLSCCSLQTYRHIRDHQQVFSGLLTASALPISVQHAGGDPETLVAEVVSGEYFSTLGLEAARGRLLLRDDDLPGSIPVAVISHSYWADRLQRDPQVLGTKLLIDKLPVAIVGVAPSRFHGLNVGTRSSVWVSYTTEEQIHPGRQHGAAMIGRLKPGISLEEATADLERLYRNSFTEADLAREPNWRRAGFFVESARSGLGRLQQVFHRPLRFLIIAAGMLLLLSCINVSGLLLAQGISRQKDITIRMAVGAGIGQLAPALFAEALLLSAAATITGSFLAYLGGQFLAAMLASGRGHERVELTLDPDGAVLLFVIALMFITCLVSWAIPLWQTVRKAPADALRNTKSLGMSKHGSVLSKTLVAGQVAVSVALLVAASLLLQHVWNLRGKGLGFNPEQLVLLSLDPVGSGYNRTQLAGIHQHLSSRLTTVPGVRSATLSGATPISGAAASRFVSVEGNNEDRQQRRYVSLNWIGPGFLDTYQIPLIAGRDFTNRDQPHPAVVLVNQSFARHYFGAESPLGKYLRFDGDENVYEVVGLVGDAKYTELREDPPRTCYLMAFHSDRVLGNNWSIRSEAAMGHLLPELRRIVQETAPGISMKITTMSAQMDASIVPERMIATIAGAFALAGLVLTAVALFSLLSYTVSKRINEFGIRMALGANSHQCGGMVLRGAMGVVLVGVAAGSVLAVAVSRLASHFVEGLPAQQATPFLIAGGVLLMATLAAAAWPTYQASRIAPSQAIRTE